MNEHDTLAWQPAVATRAAEPARPGLAERIVAVGYGAAYDAVVRRFEPYQALLDEVAALVARSGPAARPSTRVRVLDVACGTGTVAAHLAARGYDLVGIDPVAHLVEVARRRHRGLPNVRFHHADVAATPGPAAGTFDVVISMHTLYWHPKPHELLVNCRRAVRPGGHGIFLTYGRPARVGRTFRELLAHEGVAAAVRALRWLVPTAAFEALRKYEPRYFGRAEFRLWLEAAGWEVLELRETFLGRLSRLAWVRTDGR